MDVLDTILLLITWNILISPIFFTLVVYFEMDPLSVILKIITHRYRVKLERTLKILSTLVISIIWLIIHFEGLRSVRMTFVFMVQSLALIINYLKHLIRLANPFVHPRNRLKSYRCLYYCIASSSLVTSAIACLFMSVGLLLQMICWSLLILWPEKSIFITCLIAITLTACMISLLVALPFAVYSQELSSHFLRKIKLQITFEFGMYKSIWKEVRSLQPIFFYVGSFGKLDRAAQLLYLQTIIIYTLNMIIVFKMNKVVNYLKYS